MENVTLPRLVAIIQKRLARRYGAGAAAIRSVEQPSQYQPDTITITSTLPTVTAQGVVSILGEVRCKYKRGKKTGCVVSVVTSEGSDYVTV